MADQENVVRKAGQVRILQGLSDHNSMGGRWFWNDFTIESMERKTDMRSQFPVIRSIQLL